MARKSLVIFLGLILFLASVSSVSAYQYRQVLGVSEQPLTISPTSEGPGLIQPDNPLYFLDHLKQNIRIWTAFSPEAKAKVYASIAGERMAELRFMLIKRNDKGIQTAIDEMISNYKSAAEQLSQAKLMGKNINALTKSINDSIKEKIASLDEFETQTGGELRTKIRLAEDGLVAAKIKIDDSLSSADQQNEIRDDLSRKITKDVRDASQSAVEMNTLLKDLNTQIEQSSQRSLELRKEALQRAIESKDEVLKKAEQKFLNDEQAKQAKLTTQQVQLTNQAQTAIQKVQEAALTLDNMRATATSQ